VALAVVVYVALRQAEAEQTTVGGFVSFITAMLMVLPSLRHIADINAPLQRGLAAAESVFKLLDEAGEADVGRQDPGRVTGRVRFDHVDFTYPGADRAALTAISLDINPGEVVALVGPSGGGKSTLAGLLPRFYQPSAGSIAIDDVPINDFTLRGLRGNIALVSQEVLLFDDTIANNIAYGSTRGANAEAIESAAASAYALDFIRALPEGFETRIGEHGLRLSGGQRQRIAIARAILKNAPILILDEATSALDNESERAVQAALDALMRGRTTLVIAHRLSTIERADRIVVMVNGQIAEQGTHHELLARQATYAHLYRLQFAETGAG
jgi:subfamily B ATP-binding cassette protein MsbA